MAKGLPYFKFTPSEWLTGDICFEDLETQGLFINICAWYWQRDGKLSLDDINKRYNKPTALNSLSGRFFTVTENFISIGFLDEQLNERKYVSEVNSKNGSKGGRPKTLGEKPTAFISLNETKANENPIRIRRRKEEEKEKEKIPDFSTFLDYVKTLDGYEPRLDKAIKNKYDAWVANDWKDGYNTEILNWKLKILTTLPHIVKNNPATQTKIPLIR